MFIIIPSETCWDEETVSSRSSDLPKATPWVPDRARQPVVLSSFWATDFSGHLAKARWLHAHISQTNSGAWPCATTSPEPAEIEHQNFLCFFPTTKPPPTAWAWGGREGNPPRFKTLVSLTLKPLHLPSMFLHKFPMNPFLLSASILIGNYL